MNQEERNQLFEEFYEHKGKLSLFQLIPAPEQPSDSPHNPVLDNSTEPNATEFKTNTTDKLQQERQIVDDLRSRYAFRLEDPQVRDLPPILREAVMVAEDDNMAATLYLGAMGVLSACLPNVKGSWYNAEEQSNLYVFITGAAATGKGRMSLCRHLADPISDQLFSASQLERDQWEAEHIPDSLRMSKSQMSGILQQLNSLHPTRRLFVPANSSSPAMYEDISRNNGMGIIFETEADTLAEALRHGDFTDVLRKAFHGETTTMRRRTNDENIYIKHPYVSIVISGTPAQAGRLLRSTENGLFSRFIYYRLDQDMTLKSSVGHNDGKAMRLYFTELGYRVLKLYNKLQSRGETEFILTDNQRQMLEGHIGSLRNRYVDLFAHAYGTEEATDAAFSIGNRLGNIAFRMLMIRSLMRYVDHDHVPFRIPCTDEDLSSVMYDVGILFQQAHIVFDDMALSSNKYKDSNIPEIHIDSIDCMNESQRNLWDHLPQKFTTQEAIRLGVENDLFRTTIFRYIETYCELGLLTKVRRGYYQKTNQ